LHWKNTTIVGTTDEDHRSELEAVYATGEEVSIILNSINHAFPSAQLTYADILSTYAGLRPLIMDDGESAYRASRDHHIFDSASGLVSIAGGKLTTHRKMAQDLVDHIAGRLKHVGRSTIRTRRTDLVPLVDTTFEPESALRSLAQAHPNIPIDILTHLCYTYGTAAVLIVSAIELDSALGERISPELAYSYAEIPYAVRHEMVLTLNDFLIRRTHIIHEAKDQGLSCASRVAAMIGQELGWSPGELQSQVTAYKREVQLSQRFRHELGLVDH
jgi:glycerol-3-phosphate dehydrogenase